MAIDAQPQKKSPIQLITRTFKEWQDDRASRLAAALTFYAVLSIPPLLVLISTLIGQFASRETAQRTIRMQAQQWIGGEGANAVQLILDAATQPTNLSLAALISFAVLFFSASGIFVQLQEAMNTIWNVMPDPDKGLMNTIRKRAISFVMVLVAGLLFLLLIVVSSVVAFLGNAISEFLPGWLPIIQVLNGVLALVMLTGVFALMYKILPDVKVEWRDVGVGAAVTAVLLLLGVLLLGVYLRFSNPASAYGAAGSLIALMIWLYFSAQVFLLGAEFTQVYTNMYGGRMVVEEGAVRFSRVTQTHKPEAGTQARGEAG
ncbi:MAG: YihY/virulence factor BrkB family protein [Anaerolineales bacterium]|nr:YihY/virulence factor BrkB family protein [Anaerolineales bacterium]